MNTLTNTLNRTNNNRIQKILVLHSHVRLVVIMIPLIVGVLWILSHPLISIVTGEMKCRGVYIDEHQLDPNGYNIGIMNNNGDGDNDNDNNMQSVEDFLLLEELIHTKHSSTSGTNTTTNNNTNNNNHHSSLDVCQFLNNDIRNISTNTNSNNSNKSSSNNRYRLIQSLSSSTISCTHNTDNTDTSLQIVKVEPITPSTTPLEAIVIVVSSSSNCDNNHYNITRMDTTTIQKATLLLISRIVQYSSTYMAKTLLFVFDGSNDNSNDNNSDNDSDNDNSNNDTCNIQQTTSL